MLAAPPGARSATGLVKAVHGERGAIVAGDFIPSGWSYGERQPPQPPASASAARDLLPMSRSFQFSSPRSATSSDCGFVVWKLSATYGRITRFSLLLVRGDGGDQRRQDAGGDDLAFEPLQFPLQVARDRMS